MDKFNKNTLLDIVDRKYANDEIMREAKHEAFMIDKNCVEYLIQEDLTDCFNVNWSRVRKYSE